MCTVVKEIAWAATYSTITQLVAQTVRELTQPSIAAAQTTKKAMTGPLRRGKLHKPVGGRQFSLLPHHVGPRLRPRSTVCCSFRYDHLQPLRPKYQMKCHRIQRRESAHKAEPLYFLAPFWCLSLTSLPPPRTPNPSSSRHLEPLPVQCLEQLPLFTSFRLELRSKRSSNSLRNQTVDVGKRHHPADHGCSGYPVRNDDNPDVDYLPDHPFSFPCLWSFYSSR